MALRVYNGTDWDDTMAAPTPPAMSSSSNTSLSTTPVLGPTFTAPNTTNAVTGIWFYLTAVPSAGNIIVELMESGVSVKSCTCNLADLKLGYNFARFTTPHTFTTTAANAYGGRISKSSNTTGTVARGATLPLLNIAYDNTGAIGATDDAFVMGFHDSGLTTKTLTITGTSNSWGSGTDIAVLSTTNRTMGAALHIGNGGTVTWDTSASAKLTLLGSVFTTDGGVLDCVASSTLSRIATLEINNNTSDGQFGIVNASGAFGGQFIFRGATVPVQASYASGLGTAASPVVTQSAHGFAVGDELVAMMTIALVA